MTPDELKILLREVWVKSAGDFAGIGVVVSDSTKGLPITPLREDAPVVVGTVAETLSNISRCASEYHDGFHIINESGDLTHVAQYFSPPIVKDAVFDRHRLVGGRFVAALFGSLIPEVSMTGIVGVKSELSVFCDGHEVIYEELV